MILKGNCDTRSINSLVCGGWLHACRIVSVKLCHIQAGCGTDIHDLERVKDVTEVHTYKLPSGRRQYEGVSVGYRTVCGRLIWRNPQQHELERQECVRSLEEPLPI